MRAATRPLSLLVSLNRISALQPVQLRSRPLIIIAPGFRTRQVASTTFNNIVQRHMASSSKSAGPVETSIRTKLAETLHPLHLEVTNDSHLHAHHAAMRARGGGDGESHFTVEVVSQEFEGKRQMQRHRLIYSTLQAELDAGLHALVIKAKTPKEAGMDASEGVETAPASGAESAPAGP